MIEKLIRHLSTKTTLITLVLISQRKVYFFTKEIGNVMMKTSLKDLIKVEFQSVAITS